MWTCPFCNEKLPLEFQRGHLDSCPKMPTSIPINCVPRMVKPAVIIGYTPHDDDSDEGWDI